MAFRQSRRASGGVDAGVQALLYWLTIITAPVWIPIVLVVAAYSHCASNTPFAKAERARIEAAQQAERAQEQRREQQQRRQLEEAAAVAAKAPWDILRCEALFARLDQAVRSARGGSDSAAVQASTLRQQARDHACKR